MGAAVAGTDVHEGMGQQRTDRLGVRCPRPARWNHVPAPPRSTGRSTARPACAAGDLAERAPARSSCSRGDITDEVSTVPCPAADRGVAIRPSTSMQASPGLRGPPIRRVVHRRHVPPPRDGQEHDALDVVRRCRSGGSAPAATRAPFDHARSTAAMTWSVASGVAALWNSGDSVVEMPNRRAARRAARRGSRSARRRRTRGRSAAAGHVRRGRRTAPPARCARRTGMAPGHVVLHVDVARRQPDGTGVEALLGRRPCRHLVGPWRHAVLRGVAPSTYIRSTECRRAARR